MKKLGICIPTYNRADRLKIALRKLLEEILLSNKKESVQVFVSDNGSVDNTKLILDKYSRIYQNHNVDFICQSMPENLGFDSNIMSCYSNCQTEYLWFLSDDDNVTSGSISVILDDIADTNPSAIYYNFNQFPYNLQNPMVKKRELHRTYDNYDSLSYITHNPKLTSIVLNKYDSRSGFAISKINSAGKSGFMHIALALQTIFDGNLFLVSSKFIASPDHDYMDHVDFPPYIFNNLNYVIKNVCHFNRKDEVYHILKTPYVSPLNSSIRWMASFYRGKLMITPKLLRELKNTAKNELKRGTFLKEKRIDFCKASLIFLVSCIVYFFRFIVKKNGGLRLRPDA